MVIFYWVIFVIEMVTTGSFQTNSYIISNDKKECIIVDPGLDYKRVADYIKNKYTPKAILLTHGHLDHIDGILYFMDLPIYINSKEEDMLYDTNSSLYYMLGRVTPFNKGDLNIHYVKNGDTINLIGININVLETKGHTKGSLCYFYDKYLFSGDTLFRGSCGRCDFPTGSFSDMKISLKLIMDTFSDDVILYPGHGDSSTIYEERHNNPYIE